LKPEEVVLHSNGRKMAVTYTMITDAMVL